jgi:DNA-binding NtrC family response regulator
MNSVVLIDDDREDQFLFSLALEDAAVTVQIMQVNKRHEFLSFLNSGEKPDFIFIGCGSDCSFVKGCLQQINQHPHLNACVLFMYSDYEYPEYIDRSFQEGACLYILKPSRFTELVSLLEHVLTIDWQSPKAVSSLQTLASPYILFPAQRVAG